MHHRHHRFQASNNILHPLAASVISDWKRESVPVEGPQRVMSNSTTCTRQFKKLELSDSSAMPVSGHSEYVTAPATETEHAPSSSSTFFSGRTSVDELIEQSKSHWSHLVDDSDSDNEELAELAEVENVEVFKTLQSHPTWGISH